MITLEGLPIEKQLALLIHDVSRILRSRIDVIAAERGVTTAQWRVIANVAQCRATNQPPPNQAELASMLDIEPITLSRQIDRLAAAGLIERRPDPADRRAHRLYLTENAKPLLAVFRDVGSQLMVKALDGVEPDEIAAMAKALARIRRNLTGKDTNVVSFVDQKSDETKPHKKSTNKRAAQ
jgi:DNA-binding MarR family transcriptional regulator